MAENVVRNIGHMTYRPPYVFKQIKVQFAQISLNILTPIPRKDSNPSHPMCPLENLTKGRVGLVEPQG